MTAPLALLILARNEEKSITACIRPFLGYASEILVMDTGSIDRTREIGRSLGAQVFETRLAGDFASARNRLIERAKQPWIIFLDADEIVSRSDVKVLADRIRRTSAHAFNLEIRHYTDEFNLLNDWTPCRGEYATEERLSGRCGFYRYSRPLLFRSRPKIRYEYPIHESLLPAFERAKCRIARLPAVVHHFEFEKGMRHHTRKHRRYLEMQIRLLKTMPRNSPCYPMMLQSAITDLVSTGGDLRRATRYCDELIARVPRDHRYRMLKARVAMLRGRFRSACDDLEASVKIVATSDNLCLAAWNKMEMGDYDDAAAYLERALALRSWHPVSLNLTGVLNVNNGNPTEALKYFNRAVKAHPRYSDCLVNRGVALIALGRKVEGLADLRRAGELTSDPGLRRRTRLLMARHS